jgi:hypothetical protein
MESFFYNRRIGLFLEGVMLPHNPGAALLPTKHIPSQEFNIDLLVAVFRRVFENIQPRRVGETRPAP